ncbi:DNA/RNA non-specific endonuclease [Labrenzia sp. R4_1]|uniref:DNA/RNA non-specific endonuclease n=1 Tax=Labrenzia sp. R4_1 TaxID=2821106 RepID=UPI001ADCD1A2|nr:DNA/RNA non-specific endonuclease [Labrenzia sp. R4_1]MBO9427538.1 DNA/RNA non-specific endonuclease [Labrenzia sp. R4_1]
MAKKRKTAGKYDTESTQHILRKFIRTRGSDYLDDPNVTSIGIGRKNNTGEVSVVFTVGQKAEVSGLEALGTKELPKTIAFEGITIPTDVVERGFKPSYQVISPETQSVLKTRLDPVVPGASVSHVDGTAGTLGMIVFDDETGAACILSNWHVLHGPTGEIGDPIVQPGPHDDNNIADNYCGDLERSHLGIAGDCAISRLRDREFDPEIHNLGVAPQRMAEVELDDKVVKTGRTTNTTHGIVRRTDVIAKINYGGHVGEKAIGCFEIAPDPKKPAPNNEISMGGDSGSAWMIVDKQKATDIFAGLHFAGETGENPDEHALACYPASVMNKLRFSLTPPETSLVPGDAPEAFGARSGYDADFLGFHAPMPGMSTAIKRDAVNFGRKQTIPYTHFSVCLSAKRRMARFVAWNVDGARKVTLGSHSFKEDPRIESGLQWNNSLYEDNKLDRGHIARRADLAWGPVPEARQANKDSYYYTNIAPQHERYNRSSLGGLWGRLENIILEQAADQDIRVSVISGPVFSDEDIEYRGARIPRDYWKLVAYRGADGNPTAACFVLSQNDLLSDLETLDFDPFRLFQISVHELEIRTGLGFDAYADADITQNEALLSTLSVESLGGETIKTKVREITSATQIAI